MSLARLRRLARTLGLWATLATGSSGSLAAGIVLAVSEGPVSLPIYVAQSEGFFRREGVDIRMLSCSSGRSCFELLKQDKADVATASELLVTLDSIQRSDSVIVATLSSSPHHIKLIARKDAGVGKPGDLRGKRIATVAGSSAQYFLDAWLLYHQIERRDVRLVPMLPDEMSRALAQADVDAIAIWEPAASQAVSALGPNALVLPNPRVYTQHFSLITSRQRVGARSDELVRLLRALARASRFIAEEPGRAREIWRARAPAGSAAANLAEHDFALRLPQSLIATMEGQARWAAREGYGSAPDNVLRGIEPSLLRQAAPGAVELAN